MGVAGWGWIKEGSRQGGREPALCGCVSGSWAVLEFHCLGTNSFKRCGVQTCSLSP